MFHVVGSVTFANTIFALLFIGFQQTTNFRHQKRCFFYGISLTPHDFHAIFQSAKKWHHEKRAPGTRGGPELKLDETPAHVPYMFTYLTITCTVSLVFLYNDRFRKNIRIYIYISILVKNLFI